MTAPGSSAGSARRTGFGAGGARSRDRALLRRARHGSRRRPHRCRRACARPDRASRSAARHAGRGDPQRAQSSPAAGGDQRARGRAGAGRFRCAAFGDPAGLPLSHPQPPGAADASIAAGSGMSRRRSTAEAMQEGRAPARRPSRFLDLPRFAVPGEIAGEDARCARGDAARATRSGSRRGRARSCTIRCATWWAR